MSKTNCVNGTKVYHEGGLALIKHSSTKPEVSVQVTKGKGISEATLIY